MVVDITDGEVGSAYQRRVRQRIGGKLYGIDAKLSEKIAEDPDAGKRVKAIVDVAFPLIDAIAYRLLPVYGNNQILSAAHATYVGTSYALQQFNRHPDTGGILTESMSFAGTYPEQLDRIFLAYSKVLTSSNGNFENATISFFTQMREQAIQEGEKHAAQKNLVEVKFREFYSKGFNSAVINATKKGDVTLDEVIGYPHVKQFFRENLLIMKNFDYLVSLLDKKQSEEKRTRIVYATIPKGYVLTGPPGVGKTLIQEAFCNEAQIPRKTVDASSFASSYVNKSALNIIELFQEFGSIIKKGLSRWGVFSIDEIDCLFSTRSTGENREDDKVMSAALQFFNGPTSIDGVIIGSTTNRPGLLDKAMVRPGRLSKIISMDELDRQGTIDMLHYHIDEGESPAPFIDYVLAHSLFSEERTKKEALPKIKMTGAVSKETENRARRQAFIRHLLTGEHYRITNADRISCFDELRGELNYMKDERRKMQQEEY